MVLRIALNLGNQSVYAESGKPFWKGWALLIILQNLWLLSHLVFDSILHILLYFFFDV